jgi:negative regulator of flagellin synthesis FlgM
MKIDGNNPISPVGGVKAVHKVSQVSHEIKNSQQDKVAVSDTAQVFQKLVQKVKDLPDIREDRVKTVKEQIASGQFDIDPHSLAASLISSERTEGK